MEAQVIDQLRNFIGLGLNEDVGDGDHTSLACIPPDQSSRAKLLIKDETVLAGIEVAVEMFRYADPHSQIEHLMRDGDVAQPGDIALYVEMNTRALLKIERLMLNTVQRMCGVASMSRRYAEAVENFDVYILDTRKTTPLMRFLEKWAVRIGGCTNYRNGLYDRIMIKDNHITASGSISEAISHVHKYLEDKGLDLDITLEVRSQSELDDALASGGFQRIMLDNFTPNQMISAVRQIDGRYEVEASGGITFDDLTKVARTGVDFISSGALTHSVMAKDLSLKIT
ncbi:carboxylating nicotinate-nucleotide diphosphorylase [Membranihabitans maritimus]|uniref:carboxylating nicotinate-nucleotide diphosphorylase n=1 Tax=Membranihabitans maritimus TaxID=2904244 RepID=UPI001F013B28|nr:carboxylating nicotinate-nucleotide diphosphorylase [Membranihabitans maritimus]